LPEIHNPNLSSQGSGGGAGGSGGDMRGMLAFTLLALLVLFAFQYFRPKPPEPTQPAQRQSQTGQQTQPTQQASATQPTKTAVPRAPAAPQATIAATSESDTTIENEWYSITFSNRGGEVKHWILKRYYDSGGAAGGHHLDLVQPQAAAKFGYPLSLFTYDSGLTSELNSALYQVMASGSKAPTGTYIAPGTLTFHYAENGVDVVKTFHFDSSYVVTAETRVTRNGEPVRALLSWPAGLGDMEEFEPSAPSRPSVWMSSQSQFVWSIDGKQDSQSASKVSNDNTSEAAYQYAAVSDLYFTAAFLPDAPSRATVVTLHNSIEVPSDPSNANSQKKPANLIGLAMGDNSGATRLRIYAGPKAMETLASIHAMGNDGKPDGPSLEPLIQFGMWTIIAKPLYLALRFIYEHGVPNWGWAIILVTTIFYLAMLPTRLMAMKSSLKMMRVQPQVDALKKKYANLKINDPKRSEMNTEMMELYKREGVNMYGSCLPMLPQIPLFFAYFRVLEYAVELRQAHWFWLSDLSAPDPTHILPAFIIVSMFLTQYMTPSPGMDPTQRRMMAFMMPVIFGFTLWQYASGLALYWAVGNIISLVMQVFINRSHIGKEMHALALKRAAKKLPPSQNKKGGSQKMIQARR
jgi:YidC/Oxa1 family membrane protein insertase